MLYILLVYLASISSVYTVLYTVLYLFYIQCYISDYIHAMCISVYTVYNITVYHASIYLLYWCSVMGIYKEYIMGYSHMFILSYLHAMLILSYKNNSMPCSLSHVHLLHIKTLVNNFKTIYKLIKTDKI